MKPIAPLNDPKQPSPGSVSQPPVMRALPDSAMDAFEKTNPTPSPNPLPVSTYDFGGGEKQNPVPGKERRVQIPPCLLAQFGMFPQKRTQNQAG